MLGMLVIKHVGKVRETVIIESDFYFLPLHIIIFVANMLPSASRSGQFQQNFREVLHIIRRSCRNSSYNTKGTLQNNPKSILRQVFDEDGYIIVRNLFEHSEVSLLTHALRIPSGVSSKSFSVDENYRLCVWNHPGNDITGVVARCNRIVEVMRRLLGDDVYHFHSKLEIKDPETEGVFDWNQDYHLWKQFGCLSPDLATVHIAVEKSNKTVGCMKVLRGSHKSGLLLHETHSEKSKANKEQVYQVQQRYQEVDIELFPGDAVFFHCNILKKYFPNRSLFQRRLLYSVYNTVRNSPTCRCPHPGYTPLHEVPDQEVLECRNFTDFVWKDFLLPCELDGQRTLEVELPKPIE